MSRHAFTQVDRLIRALVSLGLVIGLTGAPWPLRIAPAAADSLLQPGTETPTPTPTATSTDTETATAAPADRATPTAVESATLEVKETETETPVKPSPEPSATTSPTPTATASPESSASPTQLTATATPTDTETATPTATETATGTAEPTATSSASPSPTATKDRIELTSLVPAELPLAKAVGRSAADGVIEQVADISQKTGGAVLSADDRVLLVVDPGVLSQDVSVVMRAEIVSEPPSMEEALKLAEALQDDKADAAYDATVADPIFVQYRIEAQDPATGKPITDFKGSIKLYFDLRDMRTYETHSNWYIVYQEDDEKADIWHKVATTILDDTGLIGTETDHLSIWNAGDTPGAWKFDWLRPSVSEFNGAVNYTYPIEEPPGRGGLQPNVDLSYSSAGVNNLTLPSTDQGLLGQGWSIADDISISRTGSHPHIDYGLYMHYWDTFQLTLSGRGYDLVAETESNPGPNTEPRAISRVAEITGSSTNWGSTLTRAYPNWSDGLTSGQSVTFRMKLPDASNYTLVSMIAQDTEYYRRFGLYSHGGQIYFQYTNGGPNQEGCASPSHPFTPYSNFWYVVTLSVDDANGMRAEIYEESQPTNRMSCSVALQSGRAWRFRAWTYQTGHTLYIDDYNESTGAGWHDNFDVSDTSRWAYSGLGSQQVVPFEDVNTARFYADNGPGVFITRVYAEGSSRSGLNLDKVFWVVKTSDGRTYRLGFSDEATYFQHGPDIQWLDCTGNCSVNNTGRGASDWVGVRWLVDNIWDTHLNRIAYQYRTTYANAPYTPLTDRSDFLIVRGAPYFDQFTSTVITDLRRLYRIDYNFDITYGTTPNSRIEFVDAGSDWGGLRTNQINVYHTNLTTPIRSIVLGLGNLTTHCNNGDCVSTDYITTLQLKNGSTVLPLTTFGYDIKNETTPIVRAITNGYGGRAEFTYQDDNRWEDHQAGRFPRWARSYYVTSMRESADYYPSSGNVDIPIGTPTWATTTRSYQTPCFDQTSPEDTYTNNMGNLPGRFNCPTRRSVPAQEYGNGPLVGFQTVTTERFNANGRQLAKVVTTFFQGWPDNANVATWIAAGQVKQTKAYDAQGTVVSQTDNTYGVPTYSPSGYQGGAIFVFLQTTDEALTGATTKHTVHEYETGYQGNQQFGNLTGTYENNDSNGAYRNPFARFYPNTARWIVGLPGWQGVRRWTGTQWQYETSTCLSYDWHAACLSAIDGKGELVAIRQAGNPDPTYGIVAGTQFRDHRYWYDTYGQVTFEATYPYSGTQTWYAYNSATGNVITTTYDSTYRIYPVSVINSAGQETTLSWHWSYSVPQWIQDINAIRTYFYIDAFGRVWRVLRSPDSTFTVDYVYGDTNQQSLLSPLSITTKQATVGGVLNEPTFNTYAFFDGFGRQIQSRSPVENQNQQAVANTVYDALDRAVASYVPALETSSTAFSRPNGWETRSRTVTSYDWLGRTLEQADPNGATTSLSYLGRTAIAVDANGHRDDSYIDVFGRTTSVTEDASEPTTFEAESLYTTLSNTTIQNGARVSPAVSGGHANVGYLTYGPYQAPQVAGPGQVVRFRLAVDVSTGDDHSVAVLDVRDSTDGQILAQRIIYRQEFQGVQDGQGGISNFRDFSLVFSTEGRAGHALEYRVYWLDYARMAHDKTLVTWSGGNTTTYGYSVLDQLTTVTQGTSTITVHNNALGEKDYMIDPDMGKWVYGYNELGQLVTQTDNRGCVTTLTYDKLSRIRTKAYSGPGACGTTPGVTYTYDVGANNVGHRTRMDDGSGWTQWSYDTRGRLQTETRYISLLNQSFATQYEYNPMDQIKRILMPNGEWVAYTYEQGTLNAVTSQEANYSNQSYMTSMSFDVAGRLTAMTFGNGVATTFAYYSWFAQGQGGRLQSQTAGSGNSIQNFGYTYDYVGNIKTLTDGTNSGQVQTFGYDAQDRLRTASANGVGIDPNYSQAFTYLANGNMESANTSYLGGVAQTYSYNATASSCQQAPSLTHAVSAVGTAATYSYDCNGNMVGRTENRTGVAQTFTQVWDAENRLKSVSTGGQTTSFTYDGDGARVLQQRPDGYTSVYVNRFLEIAIQQQTATPVPTNTTVAATNTPTRTPTVTATVTHTPTRTNTAVAATHTPTATGAASGCPGNSLVVNGCFETGNLSDWEAYGGSPSATTGAKYSGTYGLNFPDNSSVRQVFTTVAGQTYQVSARLRINSQSGSDWGGYNVGVTSYDWNNLGQSAYYTTANSPLGTWTLITFSFTATSSQSRIDVDEFAGPDLILTASWDEISVVPAGGPTNTPTATATVTRTPTRTNTAVGATPTPTQTSTPGTGSCTVLDSFNRANGAIGSSWGGDSTSFAINANQLDANNYGAIWWNAAEYGSTQQACVTFAAIDSNANARFGLYLKSGSASDWPSRVLQVYYYPGQSLVDVATYDSSQGWVSYGAGLTTTFNNGDTFRVVARANGQVEVYRNTTLLGSVSIAAWPYYASTGYIGLGADDANDGLFDDFGGGTYSGSANSPDRAVAPLLAAKGDLKPVGVDRPMFEDAKEHIQRIADWAKAWGWRPRLSLAELTLRVRHKALARPAALLTPGAGQTYRVSYYAGSRLVAVREVGVKTSLNFLHLDHLGSPSSATHGTTGQLVTGSTTRYYPFGMPRPGFSGGQSFTDAAFTGQIADAYTGLMYYNARYYDAYVSRFISADTVVPGAGNPQNLNRFSYALSNPLVFRDPSGHGVDCGINMGCVGQPRKTAISNSLSDFDPQTGPTNLPITGWYGENADNKLATERAGQVILWLNNYRGEKWWEGDFPSVLELTAWLLYEEGSLLNNDDLVFMARIIRYRLRNGITAAVLAGFTAFFNPNGGSTFNENDWREIAELIQNTKKVDLARYFKAAEAAYAMSERAYIPHDENGNLVLWWWLDHEAANRGGVSHGYVETKVTVAFDSDGNPVRETFYFGNEQQCREANFGGCQ